MITISSPTFDLDAYIQISPIPGGDGETRRRVSRVKTLDGGVAVSDRGHSEGDRTIEYRWRPISKAHNDAVSRMVKLYPLVNVSNADGVFSAVPESFVPSPDECVITLLVTEKVSE